MREGKPLGRARRALIALGTGLQWLGDLTSRAGERLETAARWGTFHIYAGPVGNLIAVQPGWWGWRVQVERETADRYASVALWAVRVIFVVDYRGER